MHHSDLHAHDIFHNLLESRATPVAHIVLNRPESLNALSREMMDRLADIMLEYAQNPKVTAVLISGRGPRAFCAGGDLRAVFVARKKGDFPFLSTLFAREYTYNLRLHSLQKPHIALIHGIVMGGGVGASVHGSHRVMCETTSLAMPETGIGYFPDVGVSNIFHKAPGKIGLYLALTGARIDAADALYAGFGTHFVPQSCFAELERALLKAAPSTLDHTDAVIKPFCETPPASQLRENQDLIDESFTGSSVHEILENLRANPHPFCQETYALLKTRSPISLLVTHEYLRRVESLSFEETMRLEYLMSQHFVRGADFIEGIRAAVIDKDRRPQWQHAAIQDVAHDEVSAYFDATPFETNLPFPA
ncbi:MAG: enoyl-CoA hydratase/isomerase family protein [Proteobacteria bacterium]|nr:enoyl-CoA hydratase/isomerase family protein [Pseudomonadota bacterium]